MQKKKLLIKRYLNYLILYQIKNCLLISFVYKSQRMKKNYLQHLNQYNHLNAPIEVQKVFKNNKKIPKSKTNLPSKNKNIISQKPINTPYLSIHKKTQNKQNINPNFIQKSKNQEKNLKRAQSYILKDQKHPQLQQPHKNQQNTTLQNKLKTKPKANQIWLTKCNFQPTHQSQNLYLVESQHSKQIIVCEKCSQMFVKRTKMSDFNKKNKQISYKDLVLMYEFCEQENKKLRRVQFMQKQSFEKNISKVSSYYDSLIEKIRQLQIETQRQIYEAYESNFNILNRLIQENMKRMRLLDKRIQIMQKRCVQNVWIEDEDKDDLGQLQFLRAENKKISVQTLDIEIPQDLVDSFETYFKESNFHIKTNLNVENNTEQSLEKQIQDLDQQNQPISQVQQTQRFLQEKPQHQSQNIIKNSQSPDFEKQLPFKVDFPITQTKQPINFSLKLKDDLISKISSSQELLIESLRQHRNSCNQLHINNPIFAKKQKTLLVGENKDENDPLQNFKTQASTYRHQNQSKQTNSLTKKNNFIKQLHNLQGNDIDDMMCDEDLTLSYSHPIYEDNPIKPRKSLKLTKKGQRNHLALTLSQLESQISPEQKEKQTVKSQITNPSIITASQNKHEISFQLDQNIIIDGNILPEDNDCHQNLDIISPAFKII